MEFHEFNWHHCRIFKRFFLFSYFYRTWRWNSIIVKHFHEYFVFQWILSELVSSFQSSLTRLLFFLFHQSISSIHTMIMWTKNHDNPSHFIVADYAMIFYTIHTNFDIFLKDNPRGQDSDSVNTHRHVVLWRFVVRVSTREHRLKSSLGLVDNLHP